METGPAAGEMRLSFKGSAGDALKLPITHLVRSQCWRENTGEREGMEMMRGEDRKEGMMKRQGVC